MNWLLLSLGAQLIIGTSSIFDKLLLRRKNIEPWVYTFWVGILGTFALVFLPFGFAAIPGKIIFFALTSGAVFLTALFFLYCALQQGEASSTLPAIGGLSPLFTLLLAQMFLGYGLSKGELIGFLLLVSGGIIIYLVEKKETRFHVAALVAASALLFGFSNVLSKMVFNQSPFFTGFIWMRTGGLLLALSSLLIPAWRKKILTNSKTNTPKNRALYLANRAYAGLSSVMIGLAISLTHPALVDATQSFRYIIIFLASWLILRERFSGKIFLGKVLATILIATGMLGIGLRSYFKNMPLPSEERPIQWGITFSKKQSEFLGLDWKENFQSILRDLKPRNLRLIAYWDEIEKNRNEFNFGDLDWQLTEAQKAGSQIILVAGLKVPRWPECHMSEWAGSLKTEEREKALNVYLQEVVNRYKNNPEIAVWQVENEPYLHFGECPGRGKNFLSKEIETVKSIDPSRPVLITDSGELGLWYKAARQGDIFGTTMYRKIYPAYLGPLLGVIEYPLPPSYFRQKEKLIRKIIGNADKKFIVSELQAEPWGKTQIPQIPYAEQLKIFSPQYFADTLSYAKAAGFDEYYLWGAEWWYYMKSKYNNDQYWLIAKDLLQK